MWSNETNEKPMWRLEKSSVTQHVYVGRERILVCRAVNEGK